ncbi:MAG: hypothetical protein B6U86_04260 [Candidatus Altiarchaeales archaeon ex4484_43]|nr:MAG: hypothetical protein B6U86_04260 [Candidatus Altiarchaeales archaeon ex4484_43]
MQLRPLSLILLAILLTGCITEKTRTVTTTKYVCPDKSIVSDPERCEREEPKEIIITRYVCPDGTYTEKPENCPEPFLVKVMRYVCPDGSIVNSSEDCLSPDLGTTSTTTTSISTTTTQPTICADLGCPPGTKFVGSKSSNRYHHCDCRYAKRIKPENIICFSSKRDAESKGYVPCGVCIKE